MTIEKVDFWQEIKDLRVEMNAGFKDMRKEVKEEMKAIDEKVDKLVAAYQAYKAVMKFALALSAAIGSGAAFVANLLFK